MHTWKVLLLIFVMGFLVFGVLPFYVRYILLWGEMHTYLCEIRGKHTNRNLSLHIGWKCASELLLQCSHTTRCVLPTPKHPIIRCFCIYYGRYNGIQYPLYSTVIEFFPRKNYAFRNITSGLYAFTMSYCGKKYHHTMITKSKLCNMYELDLIVYCI